MNAQFIKVLLVLDHAPDYRESFLQELANMVDLTVVAQPCEADGLSAPRLRSGYRYIEIAPLRLGGISWQPGIMQLIHQEKWDAVCYDLNLRHINRIVSFIKNKKLRKKWLWRGHIFGRNESKILYHARKYLLRKAAGCLAYNELIAQRVMNEYGVETASFNNTQVKNNEFRTGCFDRHAELRILFVGRNQPRKKLQRLVNLTERVPDLHLRMIGPGMEELDVSYKLQSSGRIELFGRIVGNDLNSHFDWADMVFNPGHAGLLVMNSAQHGKGIAIDANSAHAPEYWLAKEAGQPFIPFDDQGAVDHFLEDVRKNRGKFQQWGRQLQILAKKKYSIEYMSRVHYKAFKRAADKAAYKA